MSADVPRLVAFDLDGTLWFPGEGLRDAQQERLTAATPAARITALVAATAQRCTC
jgi:hydroxymethylpyrimidine pyrophosphatase-like HAD family hydrolase